MLTPNTPRLVQCSLLALATTLAVFTGAARGQAPKVNLNGPEFGHDLAASENILAVAARGGGNVQGTVYVFRKQKDRWQPIAALCPKNLTTKRFGERIAVSDRAVVVGHYNEAAGRVASAGAAYAYDIPKSGASVGQAQQLTAAKPEANMGFGDGVAALGDLLFVGSPADGAGGSTSIFRREGSKWKLQEKLSPTGAERDDGADQMFGAAMALNAQTLVVGAPSFGGVGGREGAAWVYTRDAQGALQMPPMLLRCGEQKSEHMGSSVALSDDLIVLGDGLAKVDGIDAAGRVYVFQRQADGGFPATPTAVLKASDVQKNGAFGFQVAVFGRTIFVGASERTTQAGVAKAGAVYVLEPVAGDTPGWKETAILEGGAPGALFGTTLAVAGSQLIVGELRALDGQGQVHVYSIETPVPQGGLKKLEVLLRPAKLVPR